MEQILTSTKKIQIIAIFAVGLTALIVLTLVLSRPNYVIFMEDVDVAQMNTIKATLDEKGIQAKISEDARSISVENGKYKDATLALAEVGVLSTTGMQYKEVFASTSLATTTTEKRLMHQLAFETELGDIISMMSAVDTARVKVVLPNDNTSILKQDKEASASVMLDLVGEIDEDQVYGIASMLASAVENLTTDNIKIFDANNTKLLFNGTAGGGIAGNLSSYREAEIETEFLYQKKVLKNYC